MAEYGGLFGAYLYALRRSGSWLFRSYVVASALLGVYVTVLLGLAIVAWTTSSVAFGERAFLAVIGVFVLVPLFAPVLVTARRHRRGGSPARADLVVALSGYAFVLSVYLALFITDPSDHAAAAGPLAPVVAALDGLPPAFGLVPPLVAAALIVAAVRLTTPGRG